MDGQLSLGLVEPQKRPVRGGRRRGAGRKLAPGRRPSVPHRARPSHRRSEPVLVTLRALSALGSLRHQLVLKLMKDLIGAQRERLGHGFRVPHFSIQKDHLHLIIEADEGELSRGLRSFVISFAKQLNRLLRRRGRVWGDRYHRRDLGSPREVRNALLYVLNNDLKHGERRLQAVEGVSATDLFSSAPLFAGWCRPTMRVTYRVPWVDMRPRTWMLSVGWQDNGRYLLDPDKIPGQRKSQNADAHKSNARRSGSPPSLR